MIKFLKTDRAVRAAVFILIAVHILLAWGARPIGIKTGHDDAQYLLLGRSIRNASYSDQFLIGAPPHRMYPPGYPAMLAFWGAITNEKFDLLVLLGIAVSAATMWLLFSVVRGLWSTSLALLCLAVLCVNPYLVQNAGRIASEAPYTFLSILALSLLSRDPTSPKLMFVVGAAAIFAALTRSVGFTLLIAIGLHWLLERRFARFTTFTVASSVLVGLWFLWTILATEHFVGRSYIADATYVSSGVERISFIRLIINRIVSTFDYYAVSGLHRLSFPSIPGPIDSVIGLLVASLGIGTGLIKLSRRWRPAVIYLIVYGALLTYWPWKIPRFLDPLVPLLVLALLMGIGAFVRRFKPGLGVAAMMIMAMILTINGAFLSASIVQQKVDCRHDSAFFSENCLSQDKISFFTAIEYIKNHLPKQAKFLVGKPATFYYYTGRKCLSRKAFYGQQNENFLPVLRRSGVTYILLGRVFSLEKYFSYNLKANCNALELIATFPPHTYLYRLLGDQEVSKNADACRSLEEYREQLSGDKG